MSEEAGVLLDPGVVGVCLCELFPQLRVDGDRLAADVDFVFCGSMGSDTEAPCETALGLRREEFERFQRYVRRTSIPTRVSVKCTTQHRADQPK